MKPAVAVHEPLELTKETRALLAWHIPDLVAYQHTEDEWWFAPLVYFVCLGHFVHRTESTKQTK
jgi:hypothetical protein